MLGQRQVIRTMKCPFDPSHVMPYQRFLNHLQKCKFPDKKSYRKCKFNPYHILHMDELEHHQNTCPDSKKYQQDEEDWGVAEVVSKKEAINKYDEQQNQALSTSNFSNSYNKSSSPKIDKSKGTRNQKIQGQKLTINKTHIEVCDLQDFTNNGISKVKQGGNKSRSIVQDLDDFNPNH